MQTMRRWLARAGLVLGGLLVGLGVAEVLARVATPNGGAHLLFAAPDASPEGLYLTDPELVVVPAAGFEGAAGSIGYRVPVRINALGLRGPEVPAQTDRERWLAIGDSFTLSIQVPEEETFQHRLAERRGIEVWNAGVDGDATVQSLGRYRRLDPRLGPDGVLLTYFLGNDLHDNEQVGQRLEQFRGMQGGKPLRRPKMDPVTRFLLSHSHIAARLRVMKKQEALSNPGDPERLRWQDELSIWTRGGARRLGGLVGMTEAALRQVRDEVRGRGDELMVALAPPVFAVETDRADVTLSMMGLDPADADLDAPRRALLEILRRLEVEACDLTPALQAAREQGEDLYLVYDGHWTAAGHAVVAEALDACMDRVSGVGASRPAPPRPGGQHRGGGQPQLGEPADGSIPADVAAWHNPPPNPFPAWYGEPGWDEVRMRAAEHLAVAGRDLARLYALRGDYAAAAGAYRSLAETIDAIPEPRSESPAHPIREALLQAARRDAALMEALAAGRPPAAEGEGIAALRARYLGLALRARAGEDVGREARALQEALLPFLEPREDLDIDAFEDFTRRHLLRVKLVEAWLDQLDPIGVSEPWGYWTAEEIRRSALVLGLAAGTLGGEDWSDRVEGVLVGEIPAMDPDPLLRPTRLAQALTVPEQVSDFTVAGLGALPTGDTLIDVAGAAGPRAIGKLQRLGLEDETHRAWLAEQEQALDAALASDPPEVVRRLEEMVQVLDAYGHGSRYYNIKQARNEVVRQLARAGRPGLAVAVIEAQFPLHDQDFACPNRAGILHAIEGRLRLQAGDPEAEATLSEAMETGRSFLAELPTGGRRP